MRDLVRRCFRDSLEISSNIALISSLSRHTPVNSPSSSWLLFKYRFDVSISNARRLAAIKGEERLLRVIGVGGVGIRSHSKQGGSKDREGVAHLQ